LGLLASFNRPGGNATGINVLTEKLKTKQLLREVVPAAASIAVLLNPRIRETQPRDSENISNRWLFSSSLPSSLGTPRSATEGVGGACQFHISRVE
jgi:hypothetical protein